MAWQPCEFIEVNIAQVQLAARVYSRFLFIILIFLVYSKLRIAVLLHEAEKRRRARPFDPNRRILDLLSLLRALMHLES
jgi:hypothetical protein